jgi:hypothetical protein
MPIEHQDFQPRLQIRPTGVIRDHKSTQMDKLFFRSYARATTGRREPSDARHGFVD